MRELVEYQCRCDYELDLPGDTLGVTLGEDLYAERLVDWVLGAHGLSPVAADYGVVLYR